MTVSCTIYIRSIIVLLAIVQYALETLRVVIVALYVIATLCQYIAVVWRHCCDVLLANSAACCNQCVSSHH
jgi:hypothetical protein